MSAKSRSDPLAPRKTARQERATKTVEAILEAAARILEGLGFDGYTTNAIAQRAGVSIGSLYQYFPNKDAITLALIARESGTLLDELETAAAIVDWRNALDEMVSAAVRHQMRRPRLARLLDIEEARLPSGDDVVSGAIHAIVHQLVEQVHHGDPKETAMLAADVIGMTRGMTDMAGQMQEVDIGALTARVRRAVLGYLSCYGLSGDAAVLNVSLVSGDRPG